MSENLQLEEKVDKILNALTVLSTEFKATTNMVNVIDSKVQHLNDKSIATDLKIDAAHKRIDEIAPIIKSHEMLIAKGIGFKNAGAMLWTFLAATFGICSGYILNRIFGG